MNSVRSTSPEANKQTVQQFYAAFAAADLTRITSSLTPDFVAHGMPPGCSNDVAGITVLVEAMHAGLQDCRNDVEDVIAEGDKVVVRYTTRATHGGELFGIPPSGRKVTMTGIEIFRLVDGRIAEYWGEFDMSDLFGVSGPDADATLVSS